MMVEKSDVPFPPSRRGRARFDGIRSGLASLIWLAAVLAALFLAVGALTVGLDMNLGNRVIHAINQVAAHIDFGEFKKYTGQDARQRSALTNWGVAAVVYLVIGKALERLVRPPTRRPGSGPTS
jgi:hypothetical protein